MRSAMFACFLFLAAAAIAIGQDASGKEQALFTLITEPAARNADQRSSVASVREGEIAFDRGVIRSISARRVLGLRLFDGDVHYARLTSFETRSMEDMTWRGKIESAVFSGDVVITFRRGYVAGLIYSPDANYEIVPRGNKHFLVELDAAAFPACGGEVEGEPATGFDSPAAMIDSGDRIDVLVVYTTATKNFLGGDPQALAHAQQAIDATNTAYINSKIRQRVRMVHAEEYFYTETSSASNDLSALRNNAAIQGLRNTHKADLVAMIGEMQGVCGIGYLMGSVSGNPNNGFTATARSCAVGNLSFAHELGHNMGSHHNPENGGTPTYPYGFGHYVNGSFRTVMSYVDPCPSGCTRVAYFSNPRVLLGGVPTGIADARDNARSINNTADTIANYRYSGSSLMLTNFIGPDSLSSWYRSRIYWTSDNIVGDIRVEVSRDEGNTWESLVASTPNDGEQIIFNTGAQTPLGRLRVTSITDPIVTDSSNVNVSLR